MQRKRETNAVLVRLHLDMHDVDADATKIDAVFESLSARIKDCYVGPFDTVLLQTNQPHHLAFKAYYCYNLPPRREGRRL